ncbi:MAG: hypothetical protein H8F28_08005 [Fibrella sp.]|nr:hypothetical protein [Armatimonadota bacterium]
MKRLLVGGLGAICVAVSMLSVAWADTLGPFNSTITYRLTDFRSGTSGDFLDFSTTPATVSPAGITPYFVIPAFDESVGQGRILQSVSVQYTLRMRTRFTVTNTSAAGSQPARITASSTSYGSLFYNTTGLVAGDQPDLGGEFISYANSSDIIGGDQTLDVTSGNVVFNNVAVGETRVSGIIDRVSFATYTFDATGFNSGAPGAVTNDDVIAGFKAQNVSPVRFGMQTFTEGGSIISGGGNSAFAQDTADQGELLVTYTFQPVPAPPAAISLAIGGLVGLIGTGANRFRRRSKLK